MKEFYKFCSVAAFCLILLCSLPAAAQVQTPRFISTSANSGGFYEYLPVGYNTGTQTYPLIVYLAGSGEAGDGSPAQLPLMLHNGPPFLINQGVFPETFTVNGNTFSFIVLSPQFASGAQPNEIDAVVSYALQNYRVDASRIYIAGISLGGGAIWGYASLVQDFPPHKIAALLPVAGAGLLDAIGGQNIANNAIAVYATHNSGDPTVPVSWTIDNIAMINAANPPDPITPIDTIFNANQHDAWTKTFDPAFTNPRIGNLNVYQWMLTHQANGVILPVTLIDYRAFLSDNSTSVTVDWTTSDEENNKYFILQRSADGATFSNLDSIPTAGNGSGHSYTDVDHSPLPGNNFYRLEQIDLDGKTTLYKVLQVTVPGSSTTASLRLQPNPAHDLLHVSLNNASRGPLQISMYDATGKTVKTWKFGKTQDAFDQSLDISSLPQGNYFLQIQNTEMKEVQQFMKD